MTIGTPYLVGSATNNLGQNTVVIPVTTTTATGDAIIVGASANNLGLTVASVADSRGNSYTKYNPNTTVYSSAMFAALNAAQLVAGTDTITVTYSASTLTAHNAGAIGCSGIMTSSAADAQEVGTNAGSAAPSAVTSTLGQPAELLVAWEDNATAGGQISWGNSFMSRMSALQSASNQISAMATLVVASTSAVTASGTITSAKWDLLLLSLKGAPVLVTASLAGSGVLSPPHVILRSKTSAAGAGVLSPVTTLRIVHGVTTAGGSAALSCKTVQRAPVSVAGTGFFSAAGSSVSPPASGDPSYPGRRRPLRMARGRRRY